jgi:hypothetical protein
MSEADYTNSNYIEVLFIESIDIMQYDSWDWPSTWGKEKKNEFLSESLEYATELELYEQCAIIRDVQKTIEY